MNRYYSSATKEGKGNLLSLLFVIFRSPRTARRHSMPCDLRVTLEGGTMASAPLHENRIAGFRAPWMDSRQPLLAPDAAAGQEPMQASTTRTTTTATTDQDQPAANRARRKPPIARECMELEERVKSLTLHNYWLRVSISKVECLLANARYVVAVELQQRGKRAEQEASGLGANLKRRVRWRTM